jgi:hypothetical protein
MPNPLTTALAEAAVSAPGHHRIGAGYGLNVYKQYSDQGLFPIG